MQEHEKAALERLIAHAGRDSDQSRRVANFLLAWWNAAACGGFDLTDLCAVDATIAADMVTVFGFVAKRNPLPEYFVSSDEFHALISLWRPKILAYRDAQDALKMHIDGRDEDYGKVIRAITTHTESDARAHLASRYPEWFAGPKGEALFAKVRGSILTALDNVGVSASC